MRRANTPDPLDTLLVVMILAVLFIWFVHTLKEELWNLALQIHHTHR